MEHPSIDLLEKYAIDAVYHITNKDHMRELEKHLLGCNTCRFYIDAVRTARNQRRLRAAENISELGKAGKIKQVSRYRDGNECPDEEVLAYYVDRILPSNKVDVVERHILACNYCSELVRGIKSHQGWRPFYTRFTSTHWRNISVAVIGVMIIFVAIIQLTKTVPISRERSRIAPSQSGTVELVAPGEQVDNLSFNFEWRAFENATRYVVVIWDEENPIERPRIETSELRLLASRIPMLRRGKTYFWQVQAYIGIEQKGQSETKKLVIAN